MDKSAYYISVHGQSIQNDPTVSGYEFVIQASDKEVNKLAELFDLLREAEESTFNRAFIPGIPYHDDDDNNDYDRALQDIYRMLHQLGEGETQAQIEQMGII